MSHVAMAPSQGRAAFAALHRHREPEVDQFEGHYQEQYHEVESDDLAGGYDSRLPQRRFRDVDPVYDGREYVRADQFEETHVRSAGLGNLKPQAYPSVVSMDAASTPSPRETYGPGGRPPSYPTSPPPPPSERERPNYKPSALRWPFLGLLLLVILSFIGLVVYAMYVLPHRDNNLGPDRPAEAHAARGLLDNDFGLARTTRTTDGGGLLPRAASETTPAPVTMSEPVVTATTPEIFPTRPEEDYGDVTGEVPNPSETRPADDYGDVSGDDPTMTRPQEDYGDVSGTDPPATRPQDDYGDTSGIAETPDPSNYGDTSGVITDDGVRPTPTVVTVKPTGNGDGEVVQTLFLTPAMTTVETDSEGTPTTIAVYPSITAAVIRTAQTTVLTDSQGQPTSTAINEVLATESVTVETDSNGVPTATKTGYGVVPTAEPEKDHSGWSISYGEYFVGRFLPTVLAMMISIPIRVLDLNARIFQPWHELTRPGGTSGRKSLCLETGGFQGLINTVRWVFGGQVLIAITTTLVLASSLLVPLSAEAIALDLRGNCVKGSGKGKTCIYVLSTFKEATGATLALLALMALLVLVLLVFLARWRSGVGTNPWSICGVASLSLNEDVRRIFNNLPNGTNPGKQPGDVLVSALKDRSFTLGYFYNAKGGIEYGVVLQQREGAGQPLKPEAGAGGPSPPDESWYSSERDDGVQQKTQQPLFMLGYFGRGLLLFVLCGILALILYYNNTGGETDFEHFMMSESFGVRFLFTAVGFIITLCWSAFFNGVAVISPYHLLEQKPQPAQRSILLAPPTNAISGIWTAVRRRHGYLAVVALTAVLAEFLPILLSEIPFRVTQTALVHRITTWIAVGVLGIMVLVLLCSFVVRWPRLPVDPTTIAGAMYYVTDSYMLNNFQGLSTLGREERDRGVANLGLRYQFGHMMGMSGKPRSGVDVAKDTPVTAW